MAEISAKDVKTLREQTGAGMMDCKRALADADGSLKKATDLLRERGLAKAGKREGRTTSEGVIAISIAGRAGAMVELACETDFVARTDAFTALSDRLARAVAEDAKIASLDALLGAPIDGEKAQDRVLAAIAVLGENVVVKRVARLVVDAGVVGGYVHAGGKLGVLVALGAADGGPALAGLAKDIAMHIAAADPSPVAVDRAGISPALLASEREIYRKQALASGKPEKILDKIVDGKVDKFVSEVALVEQPFVKDPDKSVGQLLAAHGAVNVSAFERFKLGQSEEVHPE
ncbi:MAG: translation elongation factor Ts [Deltaproteobacteria bacterium]|nr:MAG: translation elongation factor Ts [Deltaproteobacteria bacterium]